MAYLTIHGVTLTELLIALVLSGLLLAGTHTVFLSQRRLYASREQIAEMEQHARIGIAMLTHEIRLAGCDPTGTANASFVAAGPASLHVTMDLNGDGDTDDANEDVAYTLYDSGNDGDQDLGRNTGGGNQPVAENIQELRFLYTLADGTTTATPADPRLIRLVQISLTARTAKPDPAYPLNNGYRTWTLSTRVRLRNTGR